MFCHNLLLMKMGKIITVMNDDGEDQSARTYAQCLEQPHVLSHFAESWPSVT